MVIFTLLLPMAGANSMRSVLLSEACGSAAVNSRRSVIPGEASLLFSAERITRGVFTFFFIAYKEIIFFFIVHAGRTICV